MPQEPDERERAAYRTVSAVLMAEVEHWDTGAADRQGAVDAHIHYPDGRTAALEITLIGDEKAQQTEALLAADNFTWHCDQLSWWWTVQFTSAVKVKGLMDRLFALLAELEQAGIVNPEWLIGSKGRTLIGRLINDGALRVFGHPGVQGHNGEVTVMPMGNGGTVGETDVICDWVAAQVASTQGQRKSAKLARSGFAEQHLFFVVADQGTPFDVFYQLVFTDLAPNSTPGTGLITHVWIVARFSQRVLTWSAESCWQSHQLA